MIKLITWHHIQQADLMEEDDRRQKFTIILTE